mgnify:CR=1 FL=1
MKRMKADLNDLKTIIKEKTYSAPPVPSWLKPPPVANATRASSSRLVLGRRDARGADLEVGCDAGTALIAYMSSLTNVGYTATQYALLSSFYALLGKALKGLSGVAVDALAATRPLPDAYALFFIGTALIGIPAIEALPELANQGLKEVVDDVLATGGTIDKVYFDARSEYEVGDPQIIDILRMANVGAEY